VNADIVYGVVWNNRAAC